MIGCIVVAAGYGSLRSGPDGKPVPKVIERINGIPMIAYPLRMAEHAGITETVVVVNPRDGAAVIAAIKSSVHVGTIRRMPEFVIQHERRGSADAVLRAIPNLRARNIEHALITYGDMPKWSARSTRALLTLHRSHHVVTMATVCRSHEYPVLDRYGRVVRNSHGEIIGIIEHNSPFITPKGYAIQSVNPSFWIWDLEWLEQMIPKIKPFKKSDGFGDELHMPPLIHMARIDGRVIHECAFSYSVNDEALGVNTLDELHALTKQFAH